MRQEEYDYIIVGAGSAGCVIARRLIDANAGSVLLIESGGKDRHPLIHIPGAYPKLHKTAIDWGYRTTPQTAVDGRVYYLPRGRVLGGSSSTNAMAYVRGHAQDYNEWETLGNQGWSYDEVLPYFKQSEHNADHHNDYHGQGGPLHVEYNKGFSTPFQEAFIEACTHHGLPKNPDYNGAQQRGCGHFQFTIKKGRRQSTAAAFLKPILSHPRLTVLTFASVQKLILSLDKVTGVEVKQRGKITTFTAHKKVILSAGAYASPQILMQSGIGEPQDLKRHGIDTVKSLSGVGRNLQDHLFYGVSCLATVQKGQNHFLKPIHQLKALVQYATSRKGILSGSPLESVAFGHSGLDKTLDVDFQFHFASLHIGDDYKPDFYDVDTFPHTDGFTILPSLIKPKSRGEVTLSSDGSNHGLVIDPKFLSHEDDKNLLIQTGKLAYRIMEDDAFAPYRHKILLPYSDSEDDIWSHIKKQSETIYHPVGTCKMGVDTDAVVDPTLHLHGIENLMVADASIMPTIVSGNTNAAVIMIGEKAADIIING
jgi:choline dehydrogenase